MSSKSTFVPSGTEARATLRLLSSPLSPTARVREPVKRTTGRVVGYFPSVKNNRSVAWESQLEQKACYIFEFSPEVSRYREQPLRIYYLFNNQLLRYTPDFELTLNSGELIYVEIKPVGKLQDEVLQKKLKAISAYWKERDQRFIVITDDELDNPILLSNLKLLRSYLSTECHPKLIKKVTHWMTLNRNPSIADLAIYLGSLNDVYCLIANQFISTSLFEKIHPKNQIYISETHYENSFFSCRTTFEIK